MRQEGDVLPRKKVLIVAAALIVLSAAGVLVAYLLLAAWAGTEATRRAQITLEPLRRATRELPLQLYEERAEAAPPPPSADWQALQRFGWVDRERRVVHIPISVAMKLYLDQLRERAR